MELWDPWTTLRARPDIVLAWAWLPAGHNGMVCRDGDGWIVTLDAHLGRIGRRCALAHELIHIERGIVDGPAPLMVREETIVRGEVARRLVTCDELARTVTRMASIGVGVEAHHVAAFYDVTHVVAVDALRQLARAHRDRRAA